MWTKDNCIINDNSKGKKIIQGIGLFKIDEIVPRTSFDSTELDDDSLSQQHQQQPTQKQASQCKTTKYNELNSFIFTSEKSIDEDSSKTPPMIYRCNSSGPSFHFTKKSITQETNEFLQPRTNESSKTLMNYRLKPHDAYAHGHEKCLYSKSEHDTFSSILSYYDSTREYLSKELSNANDSLYSEYNFIKRQRHSQFQQSNFNNPSDSNLYYNPKQSPSIMNNNNHNYNITQKGPSCFLYMKMAQINYAKYLQNYYSKMREYIMINNGTLTKSEQSNDKNNDTAQVDNEENSKINDLPFKQMFGKNGWVCEQCSNFNFETRCICNRCGNKVTMKDGNTEGNANENVTPNINLNTTRKYYNTQPREKNKVHKKLNERKGDWICFKCRNLNFAFRTECNRCQMAKMNFPLRSTAR